MSSEVGSVTQHEHSDEVQMHRYGIEAAERIDRAVCEIMTDLARAKKLQLAQPVSGVFYREQPDRDHRYAVWPLNRDRGAFLAKVELRSDEAFTYLYLKALMQARFWESEAEKFGPVLCKATGMKVDVERTQSDGIITYSASWSPEEL